MCKISDFLGKIIVDALKSKVEKDFSAKKEKVVSLDIKDVRNDLPKHPTKTWDARDLKEVKLIIVHQSLVRCPQGRGLDNLKNIAAYHANPNGNHISKTGCPGFCYHYFIDRDGIIYCCNDITSVTWHTKGKNRVSIGVCVGGRFSGPTYKGDQVPLDVQMSSLKSLLDYVRLMNSINEFGLHNEFGKENCPGDVISDFVIKYREGKL